MRLAGLAEQVAEDLRRQIIRGAFPEGEIANGQDQAVRELAAQNLDSAQRNSRPTPPVIDPVLARP